MSGVDKLKAKILEEAHLAAQDNLEKARKEASEIMQSARNEADRRQKEIIDKAHRDAEDRKKRIKAYSELEARKKRLEAKQEMVEAAFGKAIERLNSLPLDEYRNILASMISDLVKSGDEEIILSEKDKKALGADLEKDVNQRLAMKGIRGSVKVSHKSGNINGGFILKSGDVEVNSSFDTIVRMQRNQLEAEVVKVLFQG